jgi:hypothetical protein
VALSCSPTSGEKCHVSRVDYGGEHGLHQNGLLTEHAVNFCLLHALSLLPDDPDRDNDDGNEGAAMPTVVTVSTQATALISNDITTSTRSSLGRYVTDLQRLRAVDNDLVLVFRVFECTHFYSVVVRVNKAGCVSTCCSVDTGKYARAAKAQLRKTEWCRTLADWVTKSLSLKGKRSAMTHHSVSPHQAELDCGLHAAVFGPLLASFIHKLGQANEDVSTHTLTHTHTHAHEHTRTHTHTHAHTYTHTHTHTHSSTHTHTRAHMHTHTYTHALHTHCTHAHTHAHAHT